LEDVLVVGGAAKAARLEFEVWFPDGVKRSLQNHTFEGCGHKRFPFFLDVGPGQL